MRRRCCCSPGPETVLCNNTVQSSVCRLPPELSTQYILDLPPVNHNGSGRFNTSGGEFIIDYSLTGLSPDGNVLVYFAESANCCFFGANIGTECGDIVRPFATFLVGGTLAIGYMVDIAVSPFSNNVLYGRKPYQTYPFDTPSTCSDMDKTWFFSGNTTLSASDCSGIIGFTRSISNYNWRLRSA
jgi:hypothetical protein